MSTWSKVSPGFTHLTHNIAHIARSATTHSSTRNHHAEHTNRARTGLPIDHTDRIVSHVPWFCALSKQQPAVASAVPAAKGVSVVVTQSLVTSVTRFTTLSYPCARSRRTSFSASAKSAVEGQQALVLVTDVPLAQHQHVAAVLVAQHLEEHARCSLGDTAQILSLSLSSEKGDAEKSSSRSTR